MASLDGAFALPEVDRVALLVRHDLEFDVAGSFDVFLDIAIGNTEGIRRLGLCGLERLGKVLAAADHAHATTSASRNGFHNDGVSNVFGESQSLFIGADGILAAGQERHSQAAHFRASSGLVAHQADARGRWPNKLDLAGLTDLGEVGALRKEAIAGMNSIRISDLGGADDTRNVQVAVFTAGRADAHGFIGKLHMKGVTIRFREDGNSLDAQFLARADHTQGNFAPICYKNFLEHFRNRSARRYFRLIATSF